MLGFAIAHPNLSRYTLNGRGQRVGKTDPGLTPVTHQFVYDEVGHLLGQYVVGVKLTKGTETLYLDGTPVGGSLSYLETDHLGTPRIAANPTTNAQQWKWDFFANAFGDNPATVAPSGGINVPLRYPGQLFDAETGLHYNYFRDYEPGTGRYVESDPIGLDGGSNTYAYALLNPLLQIDPLGLLSTDVRKCVCNFMKGSNYQSNSAWYKALAARTNPGPWDDSVLRPCENYLYAFTAVKDYGDWPIKVKLGTQFYHYWKYVGKNTSPPSKPARDAGMEGANDAGDGKDWRKDCNDEICGNGFDS